MIKPVSKLVCVCVCVCSWSPSNAPEVLLARGVRVIVTLLHGPHGVSLCIPPRLSGLSDLPITDHERTDRVNQQVTIVRSAHALNHSLLIPD